MSTATPYLHVVPPPTDPLPRMGWLLRLRRIARQALDLALALPHRAADWALRQARTAATWVLRTDPAVWARRGLRASATLASQVGVVPLGVMAATAPPVQRLLTRGLGTCLRWAGGLIRRGWAAAAALLARAGTPGLTVLVTIQRLKNCMAAVIDRIRGHEITVATLEVAGHALAAVAPLSRLVVLHRLMALLAPARWVRTILEAVVIPVVVALAAPTALLAPSTTSSPLTAASWAAGSAADVMSGDARRAVSVGDESPGRDPLSRPVSHTADTVEVIEGSVAGHHDEPRNRAERRAMQQAQARVRRATTRRPGTS